MKLTIFRDGDNIVKLTDFSNPNDKGEICHFISEIELIKLELLDLFESFEEDIE